MMTPTLAIDLQMQLRAVADLQDQLRVVTDLQDRLRTVPDLQDQLRAVPDLQDQLRAVTDLLEQLRAVPGLLDQLRAVKDLQDQLRAVIEAGAYESEVAVLNDGLRTLFAARPDLREIVGCKLYEKGLLSLGRAAEWSGLSVEAIKEALHRSNIDRQTENDPQEIVAMARQAIEVAGR